MKDCCEVRADIPEQKRRVLRIVLWINIAMFLMECVAGVIANSTALLADSVDMLGDAIVYGFSLYVIGRGVQWQARGALLKGAVMAAFAVGIAVEIALKIARGVTPDSNVMSLIGASALLANALGACVPVAAPVR